MRIEECGYNMITDEQGREWLLKKVYDAGWRYYAKNCGGVVYLTKEKPIMCQGILDMTSGGTIRCINNIREIMPNIEKNEVLDLAEELGIVDWSKVKVDTPILVRDFEDMKWGKRHFAFFKNGKVYTWDCGVTSWTCVNQNCVMSWKYAKLAEV